MKLGVSNPSMEIFADTQVLQGYTDALNTFPNSIVLRNAN